MKSPKSIALKAPIWTRKCDIHRSSKGKKDKTVLYDATISRLESHNAKFRHWRKVFDVTRCQIDV